MKTPWEALSAAITRLTERVDSQPQVREATLISLTPLMVQYDTDTQPVLARGTVGQSIGARVLTVKLKHYIWVIGNNAIPAGPMQGTTAQREATTSRYWQMWLDTDGDQGLYVGNKSGGWRRFSGQLTFPAAAWTTSAGTPAIASRAIAAVIPTQLEDNERVAINVLNSGTGYASVQPAAQVAYPDRVELALRFTQFHATTQQQLTVQWEIVKV